MKLNFDSLNSVLKHPDALFDLRKIKNKDDRKKESRYKQNCVKKMDFRVVWYGEGESEKKKKKMSFS